jgi:uncharacterized iron-regulated protein
MPCLAHWRVLTLALTMIATALSGPANADDCSVRVAPSTEPATSLNCPEPKRSAPALACYAAALVHNKPPQQRRGVLRRCLPFRDYAGADILVLGEIHDNWVHHALRAAMVAKFAAARNGRTAVVMEQIRTNQAKTLARYQADIDRTKPEFWKAAAAGLGPALSWSKSGWPSWADFQPIAEAAFKAGVPIYAGDVARAQIQNVARQGLAAVPQRQRVKLALDKPLPPKLHDALLTELEVSHCGLMPRAAFGNMADAQRLRDASLASAAVTAARQHGSAILLTGNGHARTDRGVPSYIHKLAPDLKVVSVAFVEARNHRFDNPPDALLPRAPDGIPAADALVVTGRVDRPDPCEKMRQRFKKKRK